MTHPTTEIDRTFSVNYIIFLSLFLGMISTSCSHLYFKEIQPKGGELQNEFPSQIQGKYSTWCYTNPEGKEICYNEKELLTTDSVAFKSLISKDSNIIMAMFSTIDSKTINIKSLMLDDLNGTHTLNDDIFLSRLDNYYILSLKVNPEKYMYPSGKQIKTELYECFAFILDTTSSFQIFNIHTSSLKKTKTIIPSGSGEASYISKKPITRRNIQKVIFEKPIPYIELDNKKQSITGPQVDEMGGIQCEPTKYRRSQKNKLKLNYKPENNSELKPVDFK